MLVLILGGGINGAALARELLLNGVSVVLVDKGDVAGGATAYSSRLIHGGLRYLEYGDFALVRESLAERTRLLRLAPQFVKPLQLFVPLRTRIGGVAATFRRLLGWQARANADRGVWLVRSGLRLYDAYARDPVLPKHRLYRSGDVDALPVDAEVYPWQCSFYDAQIAHPETFTLALLEDASRLSAENGAAFEVLTHCSATREGRTIRIVSMAGEPARSFQPDLLVNATGAWVDLTLQGLQVPAKRLIGGTKGSHFLTSHAGLREFLGGRGIYAEAADGRPFFVLPYGENTLVGTTDLPFAGDPGDAVASPAELAYLLASLNYVVPEPVLTIDDIDWHYSGVRPLPYAESSSPGAVTRRHWITRHDEAELPCYSIIGGKLTTCRSLAEEAVETFLKELNLSHRGDSQDRPLPGGEDYPHDCAELESAQAELAQRFSLPLGSVRAIWSLLGTRTSLALAEMHADRHDWQLLDGTELPVALATWAIERQWARRLADLVERRLMLLYNPRLTRKCLVQLGERLAAAGKLRASGIDDEVNAVTATLLRRYGKRVVSAS